MLEMGQDSKTYYKNVWPGGVRTITQTETYQAFSDIISNNGIPIADQLIAIEVTNNFDLTSIHCILTNESTPTLTTEIPLLSVYPNAGFGENNNILELGLAHSTYSAYNPGHQYFLWGLSYNAQNTTQSKIKLTSFPLEHISIAIQQFSNSAKKHHINQLLTRIVGQHFSTIQHNSAFFAMFFDK